jgi:23S rRNA (guanosine2251-2'-O)-methyltransferase
MNNKRKGLPPRSRQGWRKGNNKQRPSFQIPTFGYLLKKSMPRKLKLDELNRVSVQEFKNKEKNPIVLVLDNVRSLHNVGSAFRTADAFALRKIYLCGITGSPPHKEITKTALGADDSVEWEHVPDPVALVQQLRQAQYQVVSVEQAEGSILLPNFRPEPGKAYALVFGNEVFGVTEQVIADSDAVIEIPQFGTKHSLNISVAVGVVAWDVLMKMQP